MTNLNLCKQNFGVKKSLLTSVTCRVYGYESGEARSALLLKLGLLFTSERDAETKKRLPNET